MEFLMGLSIMACVTTALAQHCDLSIMLATRKVKRGQRNG